jgi:two-component system chemotaxis response regulator CheB
MISVLVVDDSAVVRRLIVDALGGARDITVVGTAGNGRLAQNLIDRLRPDVITMDIEMPEMDGIEAVRQLRKRHPRIPVIMFSTLSAAGVGATLEALAAGATDYLTKPSNVGSVAASIAAVREQLIPRIHALARRRSPAPPRPIGSLAMSTMGPGRSGATGPAPADPGARSGPASGGLASGESASGGSASGRSISGSGAESVADTRPAGRPAGRVDLLAVGCSTGGPDALTVVLRGLPTELPVPMVVTQHMPPVFTKMFAERLNRSTPLTVVEAGDGMTLEPGTVYIAPGDKHLVLQRRGTVTLTQLSGAPPENSCRPAVDVMFRSVSALYGASAYAVVLTGMGHDGRAGAKELRAAGAQLLAQDEASSVVWGMPGAVVGAGLADGVLPLDRIAAALVARVGVGRMARAVTR